MKCMRIVLTQLATAMLCLPGAALATNGYFSHGYGTPSKGMAGAGVALPLNTLAPATNPAGMVFVGGGYDIGVAVFNPNREYTVTGAPSGVLGTFGLATGSVSSKSRYFPIPSLGANVMLNSTHSLGVALYGNGGMNTSYDSPTFGTAPTGVDLAQVFVTPTYAIKLNEWNGLGVSAIVAYQRFEARGLQAFAAFSSSPVFVSDKGHDHSFGYGARVGYLGKWKPYLSVGAAAQTPVYMSRFDNYSGLFAEQGRFDIPANWTVGIAVRPNPQLDVAFDVQQIYYSSIASVGNALLPNLLLSQLGDDAGAGFGWKDMTVLKFGTQWKAQDDLILRTGYSYGKQPIRASEILFNILAPGVMEHHATLGVTKGVGPGQSLHLALMRAFSSSLGGPNPLEVPGQETITLKMNQWEVDLGFSVGF